MKKIIQIVVFTLLVLFVFIGYDTYTNQNFIPSVTNASLLAQELKLEMEERNVNGIFNSSSSQSMKEDYPKVSKLLEKLFNQEHISSFELSKDGNCSYYTIWCKDPLCGYPSGYLTRHIVSNSEALNPEMFYGKLIAKKKINGWYYSVYQQMYP